MRKFWLLALLLACSVSLYSETPALDENADDAPTRDLSDYIKDYVDIPEGAIDWKLLGKTKVIDVKCKDENGIDLEYYKPEFTPEVKALEGKDITVKGFIFPLSEDENQTFFLFGPFPISCPYHYHVGPSLVIEVHAEKNPVKFSYDPIILHGRLELVAKDEDNSTFYRLQDAAQVK